MTLVEPSPSAPPDAALIARLEDVVAMACHGVPGCDGAAVTLALPEGVVTVGATSETAREIAAAQQAADDGPCLRALREGVVVRVQDWSTEQRWAQVARVASDVGVRSSLSIPLQQGGRRLGALSMHGRRPRAFDDQAERIGDLLTRQAAGLIRDVEALRRSASDHRTQQHISRTLQHSLVPVVPVLPGVVSASRYLAAGRSADVGGDWYDLFALRDRTIGVAIGDVMGHDIAAAAAMGELRSILRSYAYDGAGPADVLDRLDRLVQGFDLALATALYGTLALHQGGAVLSYCNAGHMPPVLRRPDGQVETLDDGSSWLIGVPTRLGPRTDAAIWLPAGSTLVLYTDGLVERHRRHLDEGLDRLCRAVAGPVPDATPDGLCHRVMEAMVDDGLTDDLALLVLQVQ